MSLSNVGNLMYLYMDEINLSEGTDSPEFLIKASAKVLMEAGGRNWVPVIVKEIGENQYEVIGNADVYAIADEAGLERIWCIIADSNENIVNSTRVLTGESLPKINLSIATRDEIKAALQYLIEKPGSPLQKGVKLNIATTNIDKAPRKFWKTLDPITKLKSGIGKGRKLDALKEIFYLTPQAKSEAEENYESLKSLTVAELKKMAKNQGITGYSKKKKQELIEMLRPSTNNW